MHQGSEAENSSLQKKREEAQKKRRMDAVHSAIVSSVMLILPAVLMLGLLWYYRIEGIWSAVLLLFGVIELGMVIPVWILLQTRLKEIEGGEEDDAAQY